MCSFLVFYFIYKNDFLSWCRRPTSYDNIQLSSKIQLILEKKYLKKKSWSWGRLVKKIRLIHFIGIHNNSISSMYYLFLLFSSFTYGAGISRRVKAINMLQSDHGNVCPNLILPKCFNPLDAYSIIPSH